MESEGSIDTQKAAYDAVDGKKPIRESEIRALIAQYGKLLLRLIVCSYKSPGYSKADAKVHAYVFTPTTHEPAWWL